MSLANNAHRTPGRQATAGRSRARGRAADGLVVLTRDAALLQTVQRVAVGHGHDCAIIESEPDLANQLAADRAGVAIIDAAAVSTPIATLTQQLSAQFPELVLIVAGDARDQAALAAHVTTGTVHRFLHRPLSDERVKLFVDSAWRRHDHEPPPMLAHASTAPAAAALPTYESRAQGYEARVRVAGIALAVVLAAGIALWVLTSGDDSATRVAPTAAAGAADTFRQAASNLTPAAAGEFERLLADAERALGGEDVEEAERLAGDARALQPDHARVAFLAAQIGKERERLLLTRAREAAASGDVEGAIAVLEAGGAARGSTLVVETRRELEQRRVESRIEEFLQRAEERSAAGALIDPPQNNARFFVESARALAPEDAAVQQARRGLAEQMTAKARAAVAAGELDGADRWLAAANDSGASRATLAPVRRTLEAARTTARGEALNSLYARFGQRLEAGQLVEPANDSAKHWLARLVATDPQHAFTREARATFSDGVLAAGRDAARRGDFDAADGWVAEARTASATDEAIASLEREVAAARAEAARRSSVVSASSLNRVRYVEPRYPREALDRGTEGWVELEFTVGTDGSVGNVRVVRSDPARVFDAAASASVARWRFRPVMVDGRPVDQRARVRMQFDVADD